MDELGETFRFRPLQQVGAKFDYKKGIWFSHEYVMMKPDEEMALLFKPVLKTNGISRQTNSDAFLARVVSA